MIKAAIIAILMSGFSSAAAATLSDAHDAYDENRIPEAVRIYGEIGADRSAMTEQKRILSSPGSLGSSTAMRIWRCNGLRLQRRLRRSSAISRR